MIATIVSYSLLALCAFTLGVIAENRAAKADGSRRPVDFDLTIHLGGHQVLAMRASHLAKLGGVKGDCGFQSDQGDKFVQLAVAAKAVGNG